jgi:hypothetical protein
MINLFYFNDQIKQRRELVKMKPSKALRDQLYKEINSLNEARMKTVDWEIIKAHQEARA